MDAEEHIKKPPPEPECISTDPQQQEQRKRSSSVTAISSPPQPEPRKRSFTLSSVPSPPPPKIDTPQIHLTAHFPDAFASPKGGNTPQSNTDSYYSADSENNNEEPLIPIDPRSLLEVADRKHRYGKSLRLYFKEFNETNPFHITTNYHTFEEKLQSYQPFFNWLDNPSKRAPELKECSYKVLDTDVVEYLNSEEERMKYKYFINGAGKLQNCLTGFLLTTSFKGDMFVLKNKFFYINEKKTNCIPRFHHSSFFGGDSVNAAGIIIVEDGNIKTVFPHSGHYRPEDKHLLWFIEFLFNQKLDLKTIQVSFFLFFFF
jgi:hypothetical protein